MSAIWPHSKCLLAALLLLALWRPQAASSASGSQCEIIRIEMCRGIGYNETSMPNLVGHELQTDVEYTLQTFVPLIEYNCSSQLKLFLCAAYVPMCTPKAPVHSIGPCRSLCESVRIRCHPVLQGFGFPWPPALDCERFPRENNHETMCMEGPGETGHLPIQEHELQQYGINNNNNNNLSPKLAADCSALGKSHLYVKLQRSGRCAPLCEADILFTPSEKHLSEIWLSTWAYAALGLACVATLCLLLLGGDQRAGRGVNAGAKWSRLLSPLLWCHNMVTLGWTVRFIVGRSGTACGTDPQAPNESLLTVDGLSNAACASVFLLRYYFGMAACAWWAILCLGWHRDIRRNSPDTKGHIALPAKRHGQGGGGGGGSANTAQQDLARNNFVCFVAWGLPAFQTAAVIAMRLVDADELLGACFVGNQSDKALQVLVATPVFCYWIFGSMNLISGYLVHCRNKEIVRNSNALTLQQQLQLSAHSSSGIGIFLFIYGAACAMLLLAVIYEFANIDVWLSAREANTPLWPYLTRAFMELMLGICCFAWVLGPSISSMYKRQLSTRPLKPATNVERGQQQQLQQQQQQQHLSHHNHHHHSHHSQQQSQHHQLDGQSSSRGSHLACNSTVVSYHSVRPSHQSLVSAPPMIASPYKYKSPPGAGSISLNQMSNYSLGRNNSHSHSQQHNHQQHQQQQPHRVYYATQKHGHHGHHQSTNYQHYPQLQRYGNETLL
ncbi:frizzled-4 [Drosophila nasuta]|uniref:frizzled-4 n=1 Tax=Drosophila nasuta TaxID=42062 RepID=UPI00295E8CB4|nr:frizzled-4 [Drosophila nasuta]